jgi:hypothetical protein
MSYVAPSKSASNTSARRRSTLTCKAPLQGSACSSDGSADIQSDPSYKPNLQQELDGINSDIHGLRFYPIATVGVAYRFYLNMSVAAACNRSATLVYASRYFSNAIRI